MTTQTEQQQELRLSDPYHLAVSNLLDPFTKWRITNLGLDLTEARVLAIRSHPRPAGFVAVAPASSTAAPVGGPARSRRHPAGAGVDRPQPGWNRASPGPRRSGTGRAVPVVAGAGNGGRRARGTVGGAAGQGRVHTGAGQPTAGAVDRPVADPGRM